MGSFANTIFTALMGWMQSVASGIWSLATDENKGGLLRWMEHHLQPEYARILLEDNPRRLIRGESLVPAG